MQDEQARDPESGPAHAAAPPDSPSANAATPHTQVHSLTRRLLENAQDVVAVLLAVLVLIVSLQGIWRLIRQGLLGDAGTAEMLSEILFVLILTELYRLLIHYLSEHRIAVGMMVEVSLVSTLREIVLIGIDEFEPVRLLAVSLFLVVLGALLAMERWMVFRRRELPRTSAH
jgi:uncharacterized membrane protein (DUF373 family)